MMSDYWIYIILFTALAIVIALLMTKLMFKNKKLEKLLDNSNRKLEQLQIHFERFAPQEVIENLTKQDSLYAPQMRSVTVLFADLVGFTKMCANMEPEQVVRILNGYFQCMSEALAQHHGRVTELMGDGILALFGALRTNPWQTQDAVMGALAMREALAKYNEELKVQSLPVLSFGIGIHHGKVLAGVMGNINLSKFGVVGNTINVAARIESLTRLYNIDLLVSDTVAKKLDNRFSLSPMKPVSVKGKKEPLVTYFVEGLKNDIQKIKLSI